MKGVILVLIGLFGFFLSWKMIGLSRKGGAKDISTTPNINNEYREQKSWANSIQISNTNKSDNPGTNEKQSSKNFVSYFDSSNDSNMPSMDGAE